MSLVPPTLLPVLDPMLPVLPPDPAEEFAMMCQHTKEDTVEAYMDSNAHFVTQPEGAKSKMDSSLARQQQIAAKSSYCKANVQNGAAALHTVLNA